MSTPSKSSESAAELRERAETTIQEKAAALSENLESLSPEATRTLLHELQVHQIELELQNEELRRAQLDLDVSRARYFDLYNLAPVGYCTVSETELILEANLTLITRLGVKRDALVNKPFTRFIHKEDADHFYLLRKRLLATGQPQTGELRLAPPDGPIFWAQLVATVAPEADGPPVLRLVLSDISERKRTEQALRESSEQFRVVQELLPDGFTILRPVRNALGRVVDFTWVYQNSVVARLNGTDPQAVIGQRLLEIFPSHRGSQFLNAYQRVAETGEGCVFEDCYQGESITNPTWFRIAVVPTGGDIAVLAQDITERKRVEALLLRTDRALRMVSECNQALVRTYSERDLLQAICDIVVHHGGYRMAWVGFTESNEAKSVRPIAQAGFETGYLDTVNITWADTERGRGPVGMAIRVGQAIITRDIHTDPTFAAWRAEAAQRGYASLAAFPLFSNERAFGALTVYAAETDAFIEEEVALLSELAGDLAYGITALRTVAEHAEAERAVTASETRYRRLFESSKDGILILDAETGMVVDVNPFLIDLLGYSHEVFLGKKVWELGFFKNLIANEANFVELQKKEYIRYEDMALETRDGRRIEVEFVSNVYLVDDQKVIQCNIRDITERVRTEAAVRESEYFLKESQTIAGLGSYILDISSGLTWRSSEMLDRVLGIDRDYERSLAGWEALIHPEDRAMMMDYFKNEALGQGQFFDKEYRIIRQSDQAERWVWGTGKLQFDAQSRVTEMHGTIQDITERKQMELVQVFLAQTGSGTATEPFFNALARFLAASLNMDFVCIDLLEGDGLNASTLAVWCDGKFEDNVTYALKDTPCGDVVGQTVCCFPASVCQFFPRDTVLKDLRAESYIGATLWSLAGRPIGLIAIIGRSPIKNREQAEATLKMVATRAAAELEQREAEEKLAASEKRYRAIIDGSPVPLAVNDGLQQITYLNRAFVSVFGYTQEDIPTLADWWTKAYPDPQYRKMVTDAWNARLEKAKQTGNPFEPQEADVRCKDGTIKTILAGAAPLSEDNYEGEHLAVLFDITERKRVEESHARLALAVEQAAETIVITDTHGTILYANPAFEKTTGYTCAEAIGQNPRVLKSGRQDDAFYCQMWDTIRRGEVWNGRFFNKRKDGTLYEEEATISPIRDATGTVINFVAVKRDVTYEVQLEGQLRQSQKMEAIGRMAGGIAHDFNNILSVIFGYSNLLQIELGENPEALAMISEILKSGHRAKDLVQQILTFSRQREQERQVIHLHPIVEETMTLLRASSPKNLQIEMNVAADAPAVLANATQIYQVVMNLGTNALHAMEGMPTGRLTITLDAFQPDAEHNNHHPALRPIKYARLTVSDTGCGMDPKTLERIYDPFFTTKPVSKGTGLGLAVVHGIVEANAGVITVESLPGQGTTFRVYFPEQVQDISQEGIPEDLVSRGGGQNILMVDDEAALTGMYQQMLKTLNYEGTVVTSPKEAVRLVRENPARFDVVVTDLNMPEMNGLEVARQIREIRADLPIILATGFHGTVTDRQLHDAGISEVVEKPISMAALAMVLRTWHGEK